jgi:hypothetical protein
VIEAAALLAGGVVVALSSGIYWLSNVDAELTPLWAHASMLSYGPLLMLGGDLYFVANPDYPGSTLWRMQLGAVN